MKRIHFKLTIVALLVFLSGCDKYLDLSPNQGISEKLALENDLNVKSVLRGAYSRFKSNLIYGGQILRNAELLGGDGEINWVGTYNAPREIANKAMYASNGDVRDQWMTSYEVVNITNNVLSAIDTVIAEDRDRVEGEALFLRSLMFFDLVRFYALQYEDGVNNTQLGIPIVLTPTRAINNDLKVSRNTVEQVYTRVITDLKRASLILPEDNGVYASRGAAMALLARVYLQQRDYANARDYADSVLQMTYMYELQPNNIEVFNNDNNSSEDIFATQITTQDIGSAMTEFFSTTDYGGRDGDIEILSGHLDLYDPADRRLDLFFSDFTYCAKWNNQYGVVNLIRLAEMYLIRAESNIRLATTVGDTPVNDYNKIHERAGFAPVGAVTLDEILLERRLELAFEGFRIHDQRRLKEDVGPLPYNDPDLVFPIPEREIIANPALEQNEGY
jgi:hypothetical protein